MEAETVAETVAAEEKPMERVSETVTSVERVAPSIETVSYNAPSHGELCPTCGRKVPKKSTERVKKWRAKNG